MVVRLHHCSVILLNLVTQMIFVVDVALPVYLVLAPSAFRHQYKRHSRQICPGRRAANTSQSRV